jgi:hypothetical protein
MSSVNVNVNVPIMLPVPVHGNVYPVFNDNAVLQQLKNQIEFYFCPQNLANDQYLLSHLHATEHIGAVPIQVLCHFPKVRQLYWLARFGQQVPAELAPPADPGFVNVALRGSSVVNVSDDGMWVMPHVIPEPRQRQQPWVPPPTIEADLAAKETSATTVVTTATEATAPASPSSQTTGSSSVGVPTHPLPLPSKERNTVILRDIPASATEETILAVFSSSSEHGTPKSARPEIGNTWYVTFESEEQALAALAATRDKTIDGAPICGHLKSERTINQEQRPMSPSMPPLPPAAVAAAQDRMPAPLYPPTTQQATYYPVLTQQSFGYGYVPYGYAVPPMQQHQQYRYHPIQPRYHHYAGGYNNNSVRSQNQPQHSGIRSDNTSAPPSSVFVRPNQNNVPVHHSNNNSTNTNGHQNNTNGNGNKKRHNRKKQKNHKNQQNNGGFQSPDNPPDISQQQQQQQLDQDQNQNHSNGDMNYAQKKQSKIIDYQSKIINTHRSKNNNNHKKQTEDKTIFDMGMEQFPALGGGGKNTIAQPPKAVAPQQKPNKPGYAEALLKRKSPQPFPRSSAEPTGAELESAMNSLAFSEAGVASYDEW